MGIGKNAIRTPAGVQGTTINISHCDIITFLLNPFRVKFYVYHSYPALRARLFILNPFRIHT
jgi:hypothetical protein